MTKSKTPSRRKSTGYGLKEALTHLGNMTDKLTKVCADQEARILELERRVEAMEQDAVDGIETLHAVAEDMKVKLS